MTSLVALRECSLLGCLSEEQRQRILPLCSRLELEDGARLFTQGQIAKFLYVVEQGRAALDLAVCSHDGSSLSRPATVAMPGPGEAFGWSAVIEPHTMTLSAHAVGRSIFVLIDGLGLKELLHRDSNMGYIFMSALSQLLAERLMQTRETLIYERGLILRA